MVDLVNNKKILIIGFFISIFVVNNAKAAIDTVKEPSYFQVRYETPKIPSSISSKDAAQKNLAIYNQHIQKNKLRQIEEQKIIEAKIKREQARKELVANLLKDDRREYLRFNPNNCTKKPVLTSTNKKLDNIIDISRGGLGLKSNVLKVNDEIPVKITYAGTVANVTLKILSSNNGRVGGKFINTDSKTEEKLIYISSVLEAENHLLPTKLSR